MPIDLSKLWAHQLETYEFGKDKSALLDASSAGVGKTLSHIKLAESFLAQGGSRVLVTCPKTLVHSAWMNEITRFAPHLTVAIAEAPADVRKAAFDSSSDIVIINIDGYKWLASQPVTWLKNRLGKNALLINDESHGLKNPNAMRTKAALKIAPLFKKRHCMSGTMAPNSIIEMWSQAKIVDDGARLGKSYTSFRNLMQIPVHKGPFIEWVDRPDASEIVNGLVSDIMIRHAFDKVMTKVPHMDHNVVWYELPKKHRKLYEELEATSAIEHKGKLISAVNAATLAGKLLQCASGAVYNDGIESDKSWSVLDTGRYELIADLAEGRDHSVIFFLWRHQRIAIEHELKKRGMAFKIIDGTVKSASVRSQIIDEFQAGKLRTILIHPQSGAHGITLTKAATIIVASPVYEADKYTQMAARIRRGTQDKVTESIIVMARNTRDEKAYEVFVGKRDRLEALNSLFEGS
jgi:SNF2 family DNA or RNA helicase